MTPSSTDALTWTVWQIQLEQCLALLGSFAETTHTLPVRPEHEHFRLVIEAEVAEVHRSMFALQAAIDALRPVHPGESP